MLINVRRCYFHSIQPFDGCSSKNNLEGRIERLKCMLEYGYLVPRKELPKVLEQVYGIAPSKFKMVDNSVYLSQHYKSELGSVGGSHIGGEFSAFFGHIVNNPALVFDEHVVENKNIKTCGHSLGEEVCIQDRIPLTEVIALALPYQTPREALIFIDQYFRLKTFPPLWDSEREYLIKIAKKAKHVLENFDEEVEKCYQKVELFASVLENRNLDIPCIRAWEGMLYSKAEEYDYVEKNKEKVLSLIKKIERL